MFGLNPFELLIIFVVVVLLFGTKRLPELGDGLGRAISNFRKSYREGLTIDVTPPKSDQATESKFDQPKSEQPKKD